jgi:hypothetical protein
MCDDINSFVQEMSKRKSSCSAIQDQGWGLLTQLTLPGGGKLGVYQPRHARPTAMKIKTKKTKISKTKKPSGRISKKKKTRK